MAEIPSPLALRWLPTLLGAALALSAIAAYELGVVGHEPDPCDCDDGQGEATQPVRSRLEAPRRLPTPPGARPRPAARTAEVDALAADDEIAALQVQNELLAERAVTGELTYYNHGQAELEAMARHCDVRTDYPKRLAAREIEDLGLDADEQAAWERAVTAFAAEELAAYRAILREVEPDNAELETMTLADIRRRLTRVISRARAPEDDELQRHVAEERAGLRDPPEELGSLSTWNRYNRLRFDAGDRFARVLGGELGEGRVHELRAVFDGWPGGRTRQWGCPGDQRE